MQFSSGVPAYIPLNRQEHENNIRTIVNKHMGFTETGNPSMWVVTAAMESFDAGFKLGLETGMRLAAERMQSPAPAPQRQALTRPAIGVIEMIEPADKD